MDDNVSINLLGWDCDRRSLNSKEEKKGFNTKRETCPLVLLSLRATDLRQRGGNQEERRESFSFQRMNEMVGKTESFSFK